MYDELTEKLRDDNACLSISVLHEAADVIEELSILAENGETTYDIMVRQTSYIEELQKKMPRWIPVTEALPEDDVRYVLCCGAKGGMFVGWVATRTYDGGDKATAFVHGGNGRNITHWMPLPEPPVDGIKDYGCTGEPGERGVKEGE